MRRPKMGNTGVEWYWMIQPHDKSHFRCHPLGDGLCAVKVVRYENWNGEAWEAEPMENHATPEQEQVLDSITN